MAHIGDPPPTPPQRRGAKTKSNMAHIGQQYGPYWSVIWPILVSNMAHIGQQYDSYYFVGIS